jgi:hypothetical protein
MRFLKQRAQFSRKKCLRKKNSEVNVFQSIFRGRERETIRNPRNGNNTSVDTDTTMQLLTQQCETFWKRYGGKRDQAKSFWISSLDQPNCFLEHFAQQCAKYHCGENFLGAEYWVQYRSGNVADSNPSDGLEFHFDKDEIACSSSGVWKHPSYSTVTYLGSNSPSQWGAPIVVFRTKSIDLPLRLKPVVRTTMSPSRAWICFPRPGVHIRFEGNLLHGVPSELNPLLYSEENCKSGKYSRMSLAVNLWVKEKPVGLNRIDSTIFDEPKNLIHSPCFTNTTQHLQLHPVSVQQTGEDSFVILDTINSDSGDDAEIGSESHQEVHYLKEHLDGDTGVIPLTSLRNEYQRIRTNPSYRRESNGVAIKYFFQ